MILTSSFLPVRNYEPSGTARTNLRFVNIIKKFYDHHAVITGIFMILRDAYDHFPIEREASYSGPNKPLLGVTSHNISCPLEVDHNILMVRG